LENLLQIGNFTQQNPTVPEWYGAKFERIRLGGDKPKPNRKRPHTTRSIDPSTHCEKKN